MSPAISTPAALRDELDLQLALIDQRALVVLVEAPEALDGPLAALLDDLSVAHALPADAVTCADPEPDALRALNHDRDALMRRQRLIWLRARRPADVRTIRDNTPDLTAAVDLYVRLTAPTGSPEDWTRCRAALAALMAAEHGHLTTFGLEKLRPPIPIDEGCCPLVDWPSGEHRVLLMGGAGSGKTTALRHLAWTYATGAGDPLGIGDRVPLLVPASDYVDDAMAQRFRPWPEFLVDWLRAREIPGAEALPAHLDAVLLLVDDLGVFRSEIASRVLDAIDAEYPSIAAVTAARSVSNAFGPRLDQSRTAPRAWCIIAPRWPSPADTRRLLATHWLGPPGAVPEWSAEVAGQLAPADGLRELAACPGGLATLAVVTRAPSILPRSRPAAYRALVRRLLAATGSPPPDLPGRDSVEWSVSLLARVAWRMLGWGGRLPGTHLHRVVAGWIRAALWEFSAVEQFAALDAVDQWLLEGSGLLLGVDGVGYRFVDRSLAEALAAEELLSPVHGHDLLFELSHWLLRNPSCVDASLFVVQALVERRDDRLLHVASLLTSQPWQPLDVLARPLLVLSGPEVLTDATGVMRRVDALLAESCLATPAFGGRDPALQRPWICQIERRLDALPPDGTRETLERWLVDGLDGVAWPALMPEDGALAATANSTDLSHQDMRALLGDIPPELGRLLHRARLPVEPLVAYLRARSEWCLRVLADWTEASFAAPGDDFTLPVPDWLRAEAAAEAR